ncbi:hypothetical protein [Ravibacter arvi]|uniref:hypothetical protein n=1 Tax=Ravibacter arvi TaxID=2051041 RepID=UPI0031EBB4D5
MAARPAGPHFHSNFVWGQRFIGMSLSVFDQRPGIARAIPVDFHHCPPVKKPSKYADQQELSTYKKLQAQTKMSVVGAERIQELREKLDTDGYENRRLLISVDGSYTNQTVIKALPKQVTLIGRCRKDSKFYEIPPPAHKGRGRNKYYGQLLPTPEQIRQSDEYPWQQVKAWASGSIHHFDVKVIRNIRWRKAGQRNLVLLVVRPIAYRPTRKSRLYYRQPAYLIATDPDIPVNQLLQTYLWRWEIEVGFKDKKTLIGCGQAQIRKPEQVQQVPAFVTACYALLLLASQKTKNVSNYLPTTKWYTPNKRTRNTTGDIINMFRAQNWAKSTAINFSHFVDKSNKNMNFQKLTNPAMAAMFYNRN